MKLIALPMSRSKTQYYVNQAYVDYLAGAGDIHATLVSDRSNLEIISSRCDGLVLPGGIDVDPVYYGHENDASYEVDPEKDEFERALFHAFREKGKPIFGICRGMQLIALELLEAYADLSEFFDFRFHVNYHQQTSDTNSARTYPTHRVQYFPNVLYGQGGKLEIDEKFVNSMHHQCLQGELDTADRKIISRVTAASGKVTVRIGAFTDRGIGKKETGYIIEGFAIDGWNAPITAVQWHPEELKDYALLQHIFSSGEPKKSKTKKV